MYYQSSNPQNNNQSNFNYQQPKRYKKPYLPTYQSFLIDEKIKPRFIDFVAHNGRTYTKVIFNIEGLPEFVVLDFDWNGGNHLLKVTEGRFTEQLLNTLNNYCQAHPEATALIKKVPREQTAINIQQQNNQNLNLDNLFNDLDQEGN